MLGQLLITLIVIALAVVYVRRRQKARTPSPDNKAIEKFIADARSTGNSWQSRDGSASHAQASPAPMAGPLKMALWCLLAVVLVVGSTVSVLHWRDQQRMVTVLLYRDAEAAPVIYRVAKRDLGERTFTTTDGTRVTVSANERIEIIGL
jgi:hypothetical protein